MNSALRLITLFLVAVTLAGCTTTYKPDPALQQFDALKAMSLEEFENALITNPSLGQIRSKNGVSLIGSIASIPIVRETEPKLTPYTRPDGTVVSLYTIEKLFDPEQVTKKQNLIRSAVKHGADMSGTGWYSAANLALATSGKADIDTVKFLHKLGAPLDPSLYSRVLGLFTGYISIEEKIAFIDYLNDNGFPPDSYRSGCQNVMHSAVRSIHRTPPVIFYKLVSMGANVNHVCDGDTPLDYALSPYGPDFSYSAGTLRELGGKRGRELKNKNDSSGGLQLGQVIAMAAIGHMATTSGLSADQQSQVLTAATKDILLNQNNNELQTLADKNREAEKTNEVAQSETNSVTDAVSQKGSVEIATNTTMTKALSAVNTEECQSMQSSINVLKSSPDKSVQASVTSLMAAYQENCESTQPGTNTGKPNYFDGIGKSAYFDCGMSSEDQIELLCLNAKSYYLEYVKQVGKDSDDTTTNGLFNAHEASAKLYLKALERLKR